MKLKRNRYWITGVTLVVALQVMVLAPVDAFVISLGEGLLQDLDVVRSSGSEYSMPPTPPTGTPRK
jgi:hypothetical protein